MPKPKNDTPILELRNLGPACQEQLAEIGVHTAGDIRKLGVKDTFELMMRTRMQNGKGGSCFNATYLYALYGAVNDLDWREVPEKKKDEFKTFTKRLREE